MIDHINLPVSELQKSLQWYKAVLKPLGYEQLFQDKDAFGFGTPGAGAESCWQFGIYQSSAPINPIHLAFMAQNKDYIDEFYRVAIHSGALSNGSAGLRPQYGENYYAAYVFDFDGHNIEAVCRN